MSTVAAKLERKLKSLAEDYESKYLPRYEALEASRLGRPATELVGRGRHFLLEAHVRSLIVDPILEELGWRLHSIENLAIESPVEPTKVGGNRRFLDYLGSDLIDCQDKTLLVVEAKRPSVQLPSGSQYSDIASRDVLEALQAMYQSREMKKSLTKRWREFFKTMEDYVSRLNQSNAGPPARAVMTNGDWIIVFKDPFRTFIQKEPYGDDLMVFTSLSEASIRAEAIDAAISYRSLSKKVPRQNCVDAHRFFEDSSIETKACISARVGKGRLLGAQPTMIWVLDVQVQTPRGAWVTFEQQSFPAPVISHESSEALAQFAEVARRGQELVASLQKHTKICLVSSDEYLGGVSRERTNESKRPLFLRNLEAEGGFEIQLGKSFSLVSDDASHDQCPYHHHGACKKANRAVDEMPILGPSIEPPSYFPSGSAFHCAHSEVHSMREERCHIQKLDQYFCCRRCTFFEQCWEGKQSLLPCQKSE